MIADLRSGNEHADLEIYLLDATRDGVRQIGEILDGYVDVDAVHVLSHGNDGKLRLGNTVLDDRHLAGYAGEFAGWAGSLSDDADLMLYGCELAETVDGRTMLMLPRLSFPAPNRRRKTFPGRSTASASTISISERGPCSFRSTSAEAA
ncbi:DUF4347 domain-containing protein [Stieleria sp.]|uniref:DUF4347 domain-containing protein n=1 Tax=Stieleria sp. TaxID=2795976 RepID=UPI003566C392